MFRRPIIQPQGPLRPNLGHPAAQGMVALFDLRFALETISGQRASANTSVLRQSRSGLMGAFSGTQNQQFAHRSSFAPLGAMSLVFFGDIDTLSSYGAIISKGASSTTHTPFELRVGNSATGSDIMFGRANAGGFRQYATSGNKVAAGAKNVLIVVTVTDGLLTTSPLIYVNGVPGTVASVAGSGTGAVSDNGSSAVWVGRRADGATQLTGGGYYIALYNRALTASDVLTLAADAWALGTPIQRPLPLTDFAEGGLVGSDSTQINESSTGAISQTHILTGANSEQANLSGAGAVTQTHNLAGANSIQDNLSGTGAVTQTHSLNGASATQDNNSSTGAVAQTHVLVGANSVQENLSSTGSLGAATLVGANSTQDNLSSTGAITQTHILVGSNSSQDNLSEAGAVTQTHVLVGANSTQDNLSSTGEIGVPAEPRYARPDTDISAGTWAPSAGSSLADMLDEVTADPADYIFTTTPSTCEIKLNPVQDPMTSSGQVVRYQAWSSTGDGLTVRLMQGAAAIATWNHASLPTSPTIFAQELSPAQCNSITDYADLRFQFEAV